jgi:hypothetical protein
VPLRAELGQPLLGVVDEEGREREHEGDGGAGPDEQFLGAARRAARRVRERGVADERVPELAEREESSPSVKKTVKRNALWL